MRNGESSFWLHQLGAGPTREPLPGDRRADVAIVGAGLTGLWCAYWVKRSNPEADVVVLEARHVGYGASGRNGGWLSGKMVGLRRHLATGKHGRQGALDVQRACFRAIDEILSLLREHEYDVDAARSGYLQVARSPAELDRIRKEISGHHDWGLTEDDVQLLGPEDLAGMVRVNKGLGALYTPHGAVLNPAKFVNAVAALADGVGVVIHEGTPVEDIGPRWARTTHGEVRADVVLRTTEAYTVQLPGLERETLPMRSAMIATEPLSEAQWQRIGWEQREGLCGTSHRYFYSQRTADGRIALGGRGLPYHYGSRLDRDGQLDVWSIRQLQRILVDLFPDLHDVAIEHAWCGVLGVPRDWTPSVTYEPKTGLGSAGGYAGQGVTASYIAARTLADLTSGVSTEYTELPWTNRPYPRWEPEPLRFTGAYGVYGLYQLADSIENRFATRHTSRLARLADRLSGR